MTTIDSLFLVFNSINYGCEFMCVLVKLSDPQVKGNVPQVNIGLVVFCQ